MVQPFYPSPAATVNINVGVSSAAVKVAAGWGPYSVRVMNNGSATVWVGFGDSNVTASLTADIPIGPGQERVFEGINNGAAGGDLYAAAIAAGATGKVYFTPGRGGA